MASGQRLGTRPNVSWWVRGDCSHATWLVSYARKRVTLPCQFGKSCCRNCFFNLRLTWARQGASWIKRTQPKSFWGRQSFVLHPYAVSAITRRSRRPLCGLASQREYQPAQRPSFVHFTHKRPLRIVYVYRLAISEINIDDKKIAFWKKMKNRSARSRTVSFFW